MFVGAVVGTIVAMDIAVDAWNTAAVATENITAVVAFLAAFAVVADAVTAVAASAVPPVTGATVSTKAIQIPHTRINLHLQSFIPSGKL